MSKYYIARDSMGTLFLYKEKPIKEEESWQPTNYNGGSYFELDEELFPEVKWEDEEPKVLTIEE